MCFVSLFKNLYLNKLSMMDGKFVSALSAYIDNLK